MFKSKKVFTPAVLLGKHTKGAPQNTVKCHRGRQFQASGFKRT
jgi:hypothetical protein